MRKQGYDQLRGQAHGSNPCGLCLDHPICGRAAAADFYWSVMEGGEGQAATEMEKAA